MATTAMAALLATSCIRDCSGFSLSQASSIGGRVSPAAAATWFTRHDGVGGIPGSGWTETGRDDGGVRLHGEQHPARDPGLRRDLVHRQRYDPLTPRACASSSLKKFDHVALARRTPPAPTRQNAPGEGQDPSSDEDDAHVSNTVVSPSPEGHGWSLVFGRRRAALLTLDVLNSLAGRRRSAGCGTAGEFNGSDGFTAPTAQREVAP